MNQTLQKITQDKIKLIVFYTKNSNRAKYKNISNLHNKQIHFITFKI